MQLWNFELEEIKILRLAFKKHGICYMLNYSLHDLYNSQKKVILLYDIFELSTERK